MKLLRNSLYSLLGTALPTVLSIVTVPFYIAAIGAERYGVLAIAWLVLGYFGATDFGIGRAITQRISAMSDKDSPTTLATMASAVWSALISMAGFGALGALLVYTVTNWYFRGPFEVGEGLRSEILDALWLLAICNPVMALAGVLSGAMVGLERFRLVSMANVFGTSALMLFPLLAAWTYSTDIGVLIFASLAARLLGAAILAIGVWRTILCNQALRFSRYEFGKLANFGAWIMVTALVGPFMVYADRLVIGALQDAVAVAAYTIPFQVASRTLIFPLAIVQALFPRFASDEGEASLLRCREYAAFVGQIFAPVIIGLICLAAPLLDLWLGQSLDERSIIVAQIVLMAFWVNAVANVPYAYIQARGNPRFTGLLHLAELPLYLVLLFALGPTLGLAGYATAFAIRCTMDCLLLARKAGVASASLGLMLTAPTLLVFVALVVSNLLSDWPMLLASAILLASLASIACLVGMPDSIRARLAQLKFLRGRAGVLLRVGQRIEP